MASSLFRNQKTMRKEEKPARRTRRSFLKKSGMAGMGAQSTLIFSGLVMTSSAITSSGPITGCSTDVTIAAGPYGPGGTFINCLSCTWTLDPGTTLCEAKGYCGVAPDGSMENNQRKKVEIACGGPAVLCDIGGGTIDVIV